MSNQEITINLATLNDYPTIQNMARFYIYDRTRYMGWECPETGLYECIDFKHYFQSEEKIPYVIRVRGELAGFALIDKVHLIEEVDWNMGEFFILTKFQSRGVGTQVIRKITKYLPGKWSIAVMPENKKAVEFWQKAVQTISLGRFRETFKSAKELVTPDNPDPYAMIILHFEV